MAADLNTGQYTGESLFRKAEIFPMCSCRDALWRVGLGSWLAGARESLSDIGKAAFSRQPQPTHSPLLEFGEGLGWGEKTLLKPAGSVETNYWTSS